MLTALIVYAYCKGITSSRSIAAAATDEDGKKCGSRATAMRARLRRGGYRSRYRLRKQTVEPVFGQIKEARGFRRFRLRGHRNVRGEWNLVCTAHNVLKLAAWAARNRLR